MEYKGERKTLKKELNEILVKKEAEIENSMGKGEGCEFQVV